MVWILGSLNYKDGGKLPDVSTVLGLVKHEYKMLGSISKICKNDICIMLGFKNLSFDDVNKLIEKKVTIINFNYILGEFYILKEKQFIYYLEK